jgi:sugar lactone lactonase YvrE
MKELVRLIYLTLHKKYTLVMKKIILLFLIIVNYNNLIAQDISFTATELYPEGTAYSKKQKTFYVSSLHYGKISKVDFKGAVTDFITDEDLISSIGILADEKRKLLYVCISDPGVSVKTNAATQMKLAKVAAYDLNTGKRKFMADLGALNKDGANFANDITIDNEGNLYITNSASPIIYKVTQTGEASIFTTSDMWKGEGFNLNGIVFHKDGYLIAAQSNTGVLYKINIINPTIITKIKTNPILGADGLVLANKNELLVISNSAQKVVRLMLDDKSENATMDGEVATKLSFPTTGVFFKNKYYVLNAKLNEIFDPKATRTSDFLLQQIQFFKK